MKTLDILDKAIVETLELTVKELNNLAEVLQEEEGLIQEWDVLPYGDFLPYNVGDLANLVFVFTRVKEGATLQSLYEEFVWGQSFENEYGGLSEVMTFDEAILSHLQVLYLVHKFVTNLVSPTSITGVNFVFSILSDYLEVDIPKKGKPTLIDPWGDDMSHLDTNKKLVYYLYTTWVDQYREYDCGTEEAIDCTVEAIRLRDRVFFEYLIGGSVSFNEIKDILVHYGWKFN